MEPQQTKDDLMHAIDEGHHDDDSDQRADAGDSGQPAAPQSWKVEIEVAGDPVGHYSSNGMRHPSRRGAEDYALDLATRWTAVRNWRVVASDDEPTEGRAIDWAERGTPRPDDDAPPIRVQL